MCNYLWLESRQFSDSPFYFLIYQSMKGTADPYFQINVCISTLYLLSLDSAVKRVIKTITYFLQVFDLDHPVLCCTQIRYFDPLVLAPPAAGSLWVLEEHFNMQFKDKLSFLGRPGCLYFYSLVELCFQFFS